MAACGVCVCSTMLGDRIMDCLITKRRRIINTSALGSTHERMCETLLNYGLDVFFEKGGVRVKTNGDEIAIEYYSKPSFKQQDIIRKILREDDYYVVVLPFRSIQKIRPIRNFNIEQFKT